MAFDTQILSNKIERIKEAYTNGRFGDALFAAVNTGKGLMQQRIFTQNEDVTGQSFGQYVGKKIKVKSKGKKELALTSYQIKRQRAGRQISKKDLEFSGGLRRAIETVIENENTAVLEFNNPQAAIIAHGQEQQITNIRNGLKGTSKGIGAVKIFKLNKFEKEQVVEQGAELIKQIIKPK